MTAPSTSTSTLFRAAGEAEAAAVEPEVTRTSPGLPSPEFRSSRRTATNAPTEATLRKTSNAFITALRSAPLYVGITRNDVPQEAVPNDDGGLLGVGASRRSPTTSSTH